ncbi:MAG: hypothetical protein WC943_08065 [Elusimicrobiota bacterium]|jgi:hypothetical protein
MKNLPEPHRLILKLCTEEHVGLWFIIPHVEDYYRGDNEAVIRTKTLAVLGDLMRTGFIKAGKPTQDGISFVAWELSPKEAIARIEKEWRSLGHAPSLGDIVWFTATPAGTRLLGSDSRD